MQHSIAARNVARTAARYVRSSTSSRERRLGLGPTAAIAAGAPASVSPAALGRDGLGPFVLLRARWRSFAAAPVDARPRGTVRHAVRMAWAGAGRRAGRQSGAPATWAD